jgi:hypothetical protein
MKVEPYEDIRLLTHRKLWREESLQLVLTCLIVGGTYPRWGTRNKPTGRGAEFLRRLHVPAFGEDPGSPCDVFVDEFELPRRDEGERSGWPDWAVLWPDRVWMVELKTESGSHRPDQLPPYFDLAAPLPARSDRPDLPDRSAGEASSRGARGVDGRGGEGGRGEQASGEGR